MLLGPASSFKPVKRIDHGGPADIYMWAVTRCREKLEEKVSLSNMKADEGGDFARPTPGNVNAVCTRVIDIGTQEGGQFGAKRKLRIYWELEERISDGGEYDGERFLQVFTCTHATGEKSNLRILLEGWRGKKYQTGEAFNLQKLLGVPCLLNLIENEKGYINVTSASRLPQGMEALQPEGDLIFLDLDNFDPQAFGKLHERIQETIKKSPEWEKIMASDIVASPASAFEGSDDDIPF